MLEITKIKEGSQARESINEIIVQSYADHITNGGTFPPIVVFFDSKSYWLADGWHRLLAHKRVGSLEIQEEVHIGSQRDALRYALGANSAHGLARTNADKRNAVTIALADKEWSLLSTREVAKLCAVSHNLVSEIKNGLSPDDKTRKNKAIPDKISGLSPDYKKPLEAPVIQGTGLQEITENDQEPEPHEDETIALRAHIEELAATTRDLIAENASMGAVFDADDKLAAMSAENKKLRELNRVLNERVHGLQS